MKKLIIFCLITTNLLYSQSVKLDTNVILIGQQINLSITNSIKHTKYWPTFSDTIINGIEILETGNIDTIKQEITQKIKITCWDSGSYYIPPIKFSENSKTQGLILNVQSIKLEKDIIIKDIKDPMKAPLSWQDVLPWILIFCIISVIIYLLKKYLPKRKDKEVIKQIPKIAADIKALESLKKLEEKKLWQKGKIKQYHSNISEIIRRYIEEHFKFIALELTTEEIIIILKNKITNNQLKDIITLLERSDLAKFAKSKPIEAENIESMELANNFILSTKNNNV